MRRTTRRSSTKFSADHAASESAASPTSMMNQTTVESSYSDTTTTAVSTIMVHNASSYFEEPAYEADGVYSRNNSPSAIANATRRQVNDVENYISNCKKFGLKIDPNVVIALQTGWSVLRPTKSAFDDGSMLPLMEILEESKNITKVNLSDVSMQIYNYPGNGNSNARALMQILKKNNSILDLNLSNTGLDDDGIKEISDGIKANKTLEYLNLSRNHFGEEGAKHLSEALQMNKTIKKIDLSQNALGFRSINSLLCACDRKNTQLVTNGNYVFEEILNSVSHGIAFLGSIVGANIMITDALEVYKTSYHFWACVLYSFSVMFLFLSSCLFHSFFMIPTTSKIFQILDHVGIYMMIAGTFTPFMLIGLHHHYIATVLLSVEWIIAVIGSAFAAVSDLNDPKTTVIELTIFIVMSSGFFFIWDIMIQELSREALVLLMAGLLIYLIGIVFFILGEYKPIYHTYWHICVIIAATLHWFDVYLFVISVNIDSPTKHQIVEIVETIDSVSNAAASVVSMMNTTINSYVHQRG